MNRLCISVLAVLLFQGALESKTSVFTILTFNDVYEIVADQKGRGGFAELMTILENERATSKNSITTLNGDFLSPCILSVFDKGAHRIDLFHALGVDVVALGNHEFDFGPDVALQRIKESRFPWLAANAIGLAGNYFTGENQHLIFDVDGIKVGMFGLITLETPLLSSTEKKVYFSPLVQTSKESIAKLKEQGAEVIIALTHLLMEEDRKLGEEVPEIDVILGGHDHDIITWYDDKTFVHKSGQNAYYLTRLDLTLERNDETGVVNVFPSWNVILNKGKERDPTVAAQVDELQAKLEKIIQKPIGVMGMHCNTMYSNVRSKESEMANLVADALRTSCRADLAIITGGVIRGNRFYEPGQVITLKDLLVEMPFGNINVMVEVKGQAIKDALENGVSQVHGKAGRFPQVSNMHFSYDVEQSIGERISNVWIGGKPLELEGLYKVATVDYIFNGGDGYDMFKEGTVLLSPLKSISLVSVLESYIKNMGTIYVPLEGRITCIENQETLDLMHSLD